MQIWENVVHFCVGLRLFEISAYIQKRIFTKTVKKIIEIGRIVPAEKRIRIAVYKHERFCLIKWGNNVCLMLNFYLRDSFIKLFHHNRHFSIKGKTSVTFFFQTFLPQGLLSFWNHCPYLHVSQFQWNEFVTATALSED